MVRNSLVAAAAAAVDEIILSECPKTFPIHPLRLLPLPHPLPLPPPLELELEPQPVSRIPPIRQSV